MDLDKLQLSSFSISNLYHNNLIRLNNEQKSPDIEKKNIRSLGANEKNILIIINNPNAVFLEDGRLVFLTKVISACKLSLSDIALVNINNIQQDELQSITSFFKPAKMIIFGVNSMQMKLPFLVPDFQIQNYNNIQYLSAPDLDQIENDQALKKQLWASFQKMFFN